MGASSEFSNHNTSHRPPSSQTIAAIVGINNRLSHGQRLLICFAFAESFLLQDDSNKVRNLPRSFLNFIIELSLEDQLYLIKMGVKHRVNANIEVGYISFHSDELSLRQKRGRETRLDSLLRTKPLVVQAAILQNY